MLANSMPRSTAETSMPRPREMVARESSFPLTRFHIHGEIRWRSPGDR